MNPMKLTAPCKDYLWGGNRLREYGKISDSDRIAESWELSCHPDGESIIAEGAFAGRTLTEFLAAHPKAAGSNCRRFERFPVLVKLIDARDNLSVQVHPDDEYALRVEGEYGKTEVWYVVDADPGASLIYGFKEEISMDDFRNAIETDTLLDRVNTVPVKRGDVFLIRSGTLHAIGKGLLIAEIQQNSNTTYRVYDYGRVGTDGKPRALHIEKALQVTNRKPCERPSGAAASQDGSHQRELLAQCDYFTAAHVQVQQEQHFTVDERSFCHLLVLEGNAVLEAPEDFSTTLQRGTSLFLPAGTGECRITGECSVIFTEVPQIS
jgi:mannose-6-phosphate isomerase